MGQKRNTKGLVQNQERTPSERRESARNAGLASGEARRRKKTMREALELLMYKTELPEQTKQMLKAEGISAEDFNHQMVITRSLIAKAESGDVQAYNAICAMIGEKPAEKIDVGGDIFSRVRVVREHQPHDGFTANSEDDIPDD